MRFAIFTHVEHFQKDGRFFSYSPYVREMNLWLKNVSEVHIVAPLSSEEDSRQSSYSRNDIVIHNVPSFNFLNFGESLRSFFLIPGIIYAILKTMKQADYLHLRCPGNIGLLACLAQIFFPKKPKSAKYAGNWDPQAKQPWTYRLQKWILSNTFLTRNMRVLVYGKWPGQPKHVKTCFTASFSEREINRVKAKKFQNPFIFLFVGNLLKGKRPLKAIQIIEGLGLGTNVQLRIYGEGPERKRLENYIINKNLGDYIELKGSCTLENLKKVYQEAHFVILPSMSEGWPKAIAEGMFWGCIPIASPVSCLPWILGYGSRGILLENPTADQRTSKLGSQDGDIKVPRPSTSVTLRSIINEPERMQSMSIEAKKWSQQFTLERFDIAIQRMLNEQGKAIHYSSRRVEGNK